jgi:hypothetical protein
MELLEVGRVNMDGRKRSFLETLDYRIAVGRFESALEACGRLPDGDRELLLRNIAKQILGQFESAPTGGVTSAMSE